MSAIIDYVRACRIDTGQSFGCLNYADLFIIVLVVTVVGFAFYKFVTAEHE